MSRWPATRVTQDAPERGTVGAPQDGKIEVPTATYPVSVYPRWPCLWRIADRVAICADDRGRFLVSMILHFTRLRVSPEMTMRRRFIPRTHAHKTDRPNMVRIRLLFPRNMSQPVYTRTHAAWSELRRDSDVPRSCWLSIIKLDGLHISRTHAKCFKYLRFFWSSSFMAAMLCSNLASISSSFSSRSRKRSSTRERVSSTSLKVS